MAEASARKAFRYEGAAARYRALAVKTRDPARRRMLEEMIARELEARRDLIPAMAPFRLGGDIDKA